MGCKLYPGRVHAATSGWFRPNRGSGRRGMGMQTLGGLDNIMGRVLLRPRQPAPASRSGRSNACTHRMRPSVYCTVAICARREYSTVQYCAVAIYIHIYIVYTVYATVIYGYSTTEYSTSIRIQPVLYSIYCRGIYLYSDIRYTAAAPPPVPTVFAYTI